VDKKLKEKLINKGNLITALELEKLFKGDISNQTYATSKDRYNLGVVPGAANLELGSKVSNEVNINPISDSEINPDLFYISGSEVSSDGVDLDNVPKQHKLEKPFRSKVKLGGKLDAADAAKKKKGSGRKKKGKSKEAKKNEKEFKLRQRAEGLKKKVFGTGVFRTASRSTTLVPEFLGKSRLVHNGKDFLNITISESMIGHKAGEFAATRRCRHNLAKVKKKISIRSKGTKSISSKEYISLFRKV